VAVGGDYMSAQQHGEAAAQALSIAARPSHIPLCAGSLILCDYGGTTTAGPLLAVAGVLC
jgi:hypothetical protein